MFRRLIRDLQARRAIHRLRFPLGYVGAFIPNLGDVLLFECHQAWFPEVDLVPVRQSTLGPLAKAVHGRPRSTPFGLLLGGGTLVNSPQPFLRMSQAISLGLQCVGAVGVGVRDPAYWRTVDGFEETLGSWSPLLVDCLVTARGPRSATLLSDLLGRDVEVVGDPALDYWNAVPEPSPESRGRPSLLLCPASAPGRWRDQDDVSVHRAEVTAADHAISAGWAVTVTSAHLEDRPVAQRMTAEIDGATYVETDPMDAMSFAVLASKHSVALATRLHASVLALCGRTPTVLLAYQPKVTDLAQSLSLLEHTLEGPEIRSARLWYEIQRTEALGSCYFREPDERALSLATARRRAVSDVRRALTLSEPD